MAKPILLRKAGRGWHVFVDVDAAKRFAPRRVQSKIDARWPQGGLVSVSRSPSGGLDFGGAPASFNKGDAEHVAHKIGRYMLELGDFVDTYTETQRDDVKGRDPRRRSRRGAARDHLRTRPDGFNGYVVHFRGRGERGWTDIKDRYNEFSFAKSHAEEIERRGREAMIEERAYDSRGHLVERKEVYRTPSR